MRAIHTVIITLVAVFFLHKKVEETAMKKRGKMVKKMERNKKKRRKRRNSENEGILGREWAQMLLRNNKPPSSNFTSLCRAI
jgi:hypothetical protein